MKKPNIIFVLTDDQGYGDLACHGNDIIKTDNIDAFYNESVRLNDYHVGPTCAPTRAGLMTGHYANSTGVWHTVGGRSLLRNNEWTLPQALKENGYKTAIFGKWHLGDSHIYRPEERGFETAITHGGGGISQTPDFWGNDYFDDTYSVNGEYKKFDGYCTDVFTDECMKYIEENKDESFFCYLAYNAPHYPFNVAKKYYDMYKDADIPDDRKRFYGMITNLDENFGRLRNKLKELELEDNTILIFMTDNGSDSGAICNHETGAILEGYNAGMRGLKSSEYDGGHRVPFFIKCPNLNIGGGRDINELTANVDFMPTLLDFAGVEIPSDKEAFDGVSLKGLINGEEYDNERVIVTDSQRVPNPIKWKSCSTMYKKFRLINGKALYNVESDLYQENDIAKDYPELVERLRGEYEMWWAKVSKQFDKDVPLYLNSNGKMTVTSHDLRGDVGECNFAQNQIRLGIQKNSYWEIEVLQEGNYRVDLKRWPSECDYNIRDGIDGDDIVYNREEVMPACKDHYSGGVKLDITDAQIEMCGIKAEMKVGKNDKSASFFVTLPKGSSKLTATFMGEGIKTSPYYVVIERVL